MSSANEKSYRQIFKSTALVGGTQVILMIISIVRQKALALWLGPDGVGIMGVLGTTSSMIGTATGLGIGLSGVRQIAESAATNNDEKLARTVRTLRWTVLFTSMLGAAILAGLSPVWSQLAFHSTAHAMDFAVVALGLFFSGISAGQIALLQGLRRLREMAGSQITGALLGLVTSVLVLYWLRERGISWFLVVTAGSVTLASWLFARRIQVPKPSMTIQDYSAEARGLLGMGMAFMTANLLTAGVGWLTRLLIIRDLGEHAAGLYQATWLMSSQYVSLVLGAMAADFSPRLTEAAKDNARVNRLVNEQMELGVLIALPGVLATLTFAPWVLHLFYSDEFVAGTSLIRWQVIGAFLRMVCWPIGMIFIAKGASRLFIMLELVMGVLNVSLLFGGMKLWQLEGIGIAFALLYVVYAVTIWVAGRRVSGFASASRGRKIVGAASMMVAAGFLMARFLPPAWALGGGIALTAAASAGCYVGMRKLLQVDPWAVLMRKLGVRKS